MRLPEASVGFEVLGVEVDCTKPAPFLLADRGWLSKLSLF